MKQIGYSFLVLLLAGATGVAQQFWVPTNGPWYSKVHDFAIGVNDNGVVMYAADSSEGSLLKSTDRGNSWIHILGGVGSIVNCVATVRDKPEVVYAGVFQSGGGLQTGVYKSTDLGNTWQRLPNQPGNLLISRIAIHPTNSEII